MAINLMVIPIKLNILVSIVKEHCQRFHNVLTFPYICEGRLYFDIKLKQKMPLSLPVVLLLLFFRKKIEVKRFLLPTYPF